MLVATSRVGRKADCSAILDLYENANIFIFKLFSGNLSPSLRRNLWLTCGINYCAPPRRYTWCEAPEPLGLDASISLRLQRTSTLHICMSPHAYAYSAPPELQSSFPLCLHACTPAVRLQCSIPPYSTSARLQRDSRAQQLQYLHASTIPGPQSASRAPCLDIAAPSAHHQISEPPYRYACSASPELHTSMLPRSQVYSAPPEL